MGFSLKSWFRLHPDNISAIRALAPAPLEEALLDRSRTTYVFSRRGGSPVRIYTLKEFCHGCQL